MHELQQARRRVWLAGRTEFRHKALPGAWRLGSRCVFLLFSPSGELRQSRGMPLVVCGTRPYRIFHRHLLASCLRPLKL